MLPAKPKKRPAFPILPLPMKQKHVLPHVPSETNAIKLFEAVFNQFGVFVFNKLS